MGLWELTGELAKENGEFALFTTAGGDPEDAKRTQAPWGKCQKREGTKSTIEENL